MAPSGAGADGAKMQRLRKELRRLVAEDYAVMSTCVPTPGGDVCQPVHVLLGRGDQVRNRLTLLRVHARHPGRDGHLHVGHLGGNQRGGE